MSKFLMGREESLLLSPIQKLALWRRARENLQGIARDQLLEIPPLPQVKKPKWYRGKSIVSDGPPPPSVQPAKEEKFFPNSFSSYSNGRQISTLPESVATDHFRQVPESNSIVISSSEHVSDEGPRQRSLQEEVRTLLLKGAVELVNPPLTPGFYCRLFLVPKKNGKTRPVIDLSVLNQHLIVPHFKMETNRSIRGSIHLGMWTTSLDLTDAFFHIHISPKFGKFLRFVFFWEDRVCTYKTMPFGLSTPL